MQTNTRSNITASPDPGRSGHNPAVYLSSAVQYFSAYIMALAKDAVLPDMAEPAAVICMAPDLPPCLDFSDRVDLLDDREGIQVMRDRHTGLMISCHEGDLLFDDEDDDGVLLIGPAVVYRSENGTLCSVTSLDFRDIKKLYFLGRKTIELDSVKLPAVRLGSAGDLFS